jgi:predicted nucleic acid-binding protein
MTYLDAAYIAKFYLEEPDSDRVRHFLASTHPVASCVHGMVEVASVFHRKLREGVMPQAEFDLFCAQFEADCQAGLWTWLPMPEELAHAARQRISKLPAHIFLRAADALHLTCAEEYGFRTIHTSDRHMVAAAPAFGLQAVSL